MPIGKWYTNLGWHAYAAATASLGIIGLIWGDFATYWQIVPEAVPHRRFLAYLVASSLLLSAILLEWRRTRRGAAIAITAMYFAFAFTWLPRIIGFPSMYGVWNGAAEELAFAAAGLVILGSQSDRTGRPNKMIATGRILFGVCAVSFGVEHFKAIPQTVAMIPRWIPKPDAWAVATGVFFILAGLAIISGIQTLLASRLLTVMFLTFSFLLWTPSLIAHPMNHTVWAGSAINFAAAASAWAVADMIQQVVQPQIIRRP